jgi:transcriptional regulator with XRE-family HTH domain
LVEISQQKLADTAGLSLSSVRDYENERRSGDFAGLHAIRRALENEGVEFLPGSADAGPGVRLNIRLPAVLRRPNRLINESLLVPIEWKGQEISLLVSREALEDLGQIPGGRELTNPDFVSLFEHHRAVILAAAAKAIDADDVTPDHRVYVTTDDVC